MLKHKEGSANNGFQRPLRRSVVFDADKGKIYRFNLTFIEVIRLKGSYPAAYYKSEEDCFWKNYTPSLDFPFLFPKPYPLLDEGSSAQLQKYINYLLDLYASIVNYIGRDKISAIEQFNERHWFLYSLLENCKEPAMELLQSNPAMAYLISAHGVFHTLKSRQYWRSARSLIRKKRKDILAYFGFPASEATVKLFSRIAPEDCNNELLFTLHKKLQDHPEYLRELSFYPVHNRHSLNIVLSGFRPAFTHSAINEIASLKSPESGLFSLSTVRDVFRMQKTLADHGYPAQKILFRSIRDIDVIHDELVDIMNWIVSVHDYQYQPSPLKEVKRSSLWIESINSAMDLHREGFGMHHCIYSYHEIIAQGRYFAARMLYPERLTILYKESISTFDHTIKYELVDARGAYNQGPNENSLRLIGQWLKKQITEYYDPNQLTIFDDDLEFMDVSQI